MLFVLKFQPTALKQLLLFSRYIECRSEHMQQSKYVGRYVEWAGNDRAALLQ